MNETMQVENIVDDKFILIKYSIGNRKSNILATKFKQNKRNKTCFLFTYKEEKFNPNKEAFQL